MFGGMSSSRYALGFLTVVVLAGCKTTKAPATKIEAEKAALVSGDADKIRDATSGFQACGEQPYVAGKSVYQDTCLDTIAKELGGTETLIVTPPDNTASGVAALVILRDSRGDAFTHSDTWLNTLKTGKGAGHDALRLAVARKMEAAIPLVGKSIEGDDGARAAMKAVVGAIPGACNTYYLIGNGAPLEKMPPALTAEKSVCIQRDLSRPDRPGMYGKGIQRALEGSLALWRETEKALRAGLSVSDDETKTILEKQLTSVIEPATRSIKTKYDDKEKALTDTLKAMNAGAGSDEAGAPPAIPAIPSGIPAPKPSH